MTKIVKNCIVYSERTNTTAFIRGGDGMRSNEDLMRGVLHRKAVYLAQKQARKLTAVGAGLAVLLMITLMIAPGISGSVEQHTASAMGATILGPEAGGYVLVALLAFALGIVITLLIQKRRTMKTADTEKAERSCGHE